MRRFDGERLVRDVVRIDDVQVLKTTDAWRRRRKPKTLSEQRQLSVLRNRPATGDVTRLIIATGRKWERIVGPRRKCPDPLHVIFALTRPSHPPVAVLESRIVVP